MPLYSNCYSFRSSFGRQVRTSRTDSLDEAAICFIRSQNKQIFAIDIGCGEGVQSIEMAMAGAQVSSIDIVNSMQKIRQKAKNSGLLPSSVRFIHYDVSDIKLLMLKFSKIAKPTLVYSQRTLHYLPFSKACNVLNSLSKIMTSESRLYLSLSGLQSELGRFYAHKYRSVERRFCSINERMANKHNILMPICLYDVSDACLLVKKAGFAVVSAETSAFGNIKLVAEVV
jgi:ubiquinone/menaquinone biosynthesis C-methylase UbiE